MPEIVVDFFRMGGYAFYVWWSYAIVFAVLALNLVAPSLRHRRVHRALAREHASRGPSPQ
ncbi:MAG: heme exporter protein CcmD [Gammaproteobacteria bacterium]|nr:heme exporter protein CcmD [Gammaproteobacteria bacterium]